MKQVYMQCMDALGTTIELQLVTSSVEHAEHWFAILWNEVRTFEARFSRFRPESELTLFNLRAGTQVPTSPHLTHILEIARALSIRTGGLFNPFILPRLQQQGYRTSMTEPQTDTPDFSSRYVAHSTDLEIGDTWARIPPNTALDLGGIGKGYLADQLAGLVSNDGDVFGCCFSLGGDIHIRGLDASDNPWEIDIQSAENRATDLAVFTCTTDVAGIATSGLIREKRGRQQAHQVYPTEQNPDSTTFSVCTATAENATVADVLASSILIGGEEFALKMLREGVITGALLQRTDGPPSVLGTGIALLHPKN